MTTIGISYTLTISQISTKLGLRIGSTIKSYEGTPAHGKDNSQRNISSPNGEHATFPKGTSVQQEGWNTPIDLSNGELKYANFLKMRDQFGPFNPRYTSNSPENERKGKRQRKLTYHVSIKQASPVFLVYNDVRASVDSLRQNIESSCYSPEKIQKYLSMSLDDWIHWTYSFQNPFRENNKQSDHYYKTLHPETLRAALAHVMRPEDIIDSITLSSRRVVECADDVDSCSNVLRDEKNYPLQIHFARPYSPFITGGKKEGPKQGAQPEKAPSSNECIEILDSSDDDESAQNQALMTNNNQIPNHKHHQTTNFNSPSHLMAEPTKIQYNEQLPECQVSQFNFLPVAPSDPLPEYDREEWVMTCCGPGKILSHEIKRLALSDYYLNRPFIMYQIKLPFAVIYSTGMDVEPFSNSEIAVRNVLKFGGVELNYMDVLRLEPHTYINDSLVNFYIKYLIQERLPQHLYQQNINQSLAKEIHIFPTYFYARMSNLEGKSSYKNTREGRKQLWKDLRGWTNGVDIFTKRLLIVPVNYALHWTFALVCNPGLPVGVKPKTHGFDGVNFSELKCCIMNLDSGKQFRLHRTQTINDVIRRYLNANFENSFYFRPIKYSTVEQRRLQATKVFNAISLPSFSPDCPVQNNLKDCGLYMLDMMEGVLLSPPFVNESFIENRASGWYPFKAKNDCDIRRKRYEMKALIYKIIEREREELDEDEDDYE